MRVDTLSLRTAAPVVLAVLAVPALWYYANRHDEIDLMVYRNAIQAWAAGGDLYGYRLPNGGAGLPFVYPPLAAFLLSPLAGMPYPVAVGVTYAVNTALLLALVRLSTPWLPARWVVPLSCAAFALGPVCSTFALGQVDLLVGVLVAADVLVLTARYPRWAGIGVGLAVAIKLTPALFVGYLLLTGRRRAAGQAVATAIAGALLAATAAPALSWDYWTERLWQTERVGRPDSAANVSVSGLLARLQESADPNRVLWLVLAALVVVVAVAGLRPWHQPDDLRGIVVAGVTAGLVSPITWVHHVVWLIPAVAVLADAARRAPRWWWAVAATCAVSAAGLNERYRRETTEHLDGGLLGVLGENSVTLGLLALLVLIPLTRGAAVTGRAGSPGSACRADRARPDPANEPA